MVIQIPYLYGSLEHLKLITNSGHKMVCKSHSHLVNQALQWASLSFLNHSLSNHECMMTSSLLSSYALDPINVFTVCLWLLAQSKIEMQKCKISHDLNPLIIKSHVDPPKFPSPRAVFWLLHSLRGGACPYVCHSGYTTIILSISVIILIKNNVICSQVVSSKCKRNTTWLATVKMKHK